MRTFAHYCFCMIFVYNAILFLVTLVGGAMPLWSKEWTEQRMKYLLAFSGSFLLSVTFLHLIPESIEHIGPFSGFLLVCGFFLQQFFQKFTHGVEHGHKHVVNHVHAGIPVWSVFWGLALHAFAEGLPLGIFYSESVILPSLFLAIALHKLPEAMLIISLFYQHNRNKKQTWIILVLFSLITPFSSLAAYLIGYQFAVVEQIIQWIVPLIAGAFIHISTTIFFESGTKAHDMTIKKWMVVLLGVGFGMLSLLGAH